MYHIKYIYCIKNNARKHAERIMIINNEIHMKKNKNKRKHTEKHSKNYFGPRTSHEEVKKQEGKRKKEKRRRGKFIYTQYILFFFPV